MRNFLTFSLLFLAGFLYACNNKAGREESEAPAEENRWTSYEDAAFLEEAYRNNLMILHLADKAIPKAQTPALRNFANQSVAYYKNLNAQLVRKAKNNSINWQKKELEEKEKKQLENLQEKEGEAFETSLLNRSKDILNEQIKLFEEASGKASPKNIRNWASKITTNLKAHLQAVKELEKDI